MNKICRDCSIEYPLTTEYFYREPRIYKLKNNTYIKTYYWQKICKSCNKIRNRKYMRQYMKLNIECENIIDIVDEVLSNRGENWLDYLREQNRTKEWLRKKEKICVH